MKRVTAIIFLLLIISGCSFSKVYTDAIEETEEHLNNEEFDQALESVEIALNEKEDDDVALNIESGLLKYQKLINYKEQRNWEETEEVINSFGTLDSVHPKLKKQVDKINKEMLEQIELERQLENDLKKAKTKLNNDQFDEADALLEGLESNASFKFADEKIKLVRENYDEKYKSFKKDEKKAELLSKYEKELTELETKTSKIKQKNKEDQSFNRLNDVEKDYDDLLNEVYQKIIKELPKKEEELREIQREWLVNFESKLYEVRYNSGDYKAVEYSIKNKKKRINELLNNYLK